jgi:hypothetical protein
MTSNAPIFNQPTNRDRLTEADATRQGYGSVFDFLAIWNTIADYSRKERLLKEPIRLNQLPAEAIWFGVKSGTIGTMIGVGLIMLRLGVFGLCFYLLNLDRDIANLVYLSIVVILSLQYFTTLADYLRYPGGMTDSLIKINVSCLIGSVITVEIMKLIGIAALFLCYGQIVMLIPDSPAYMTMLKWFYGYFLNQPWKLVLESWLQMQIIICGVGLVNQRRRSLEKKAEFDLVGVE